MKILKKLLQKFESKKRKTVLEDILNNSKRISTSVTLGYEADRWGIERIALDGIQNHLPNDSKGSKVNVDFLVNNKWISRTDYQNGIIQAIRFSDDGVGYSNELLGIFHSTKKDNPNAVGYFGEGLKMLSAAAIREGIDMELRSRDWSAKPVAVDLQIDGEKIKKLAYDIKPAEKIKGSQTIFWNPNQDFIDYVKNLDKKVLLLRKEFNPLYEAGKRAIIDTEGEIFVKGIYISSLFKDRLLFSYNLDVIPNRDRDNIHESKLIDELRMIWSNIDKIEPIKHLLRVAQNDPEKLGNSYELYILRNFYYKSSNSEELWKRAFRELYGENAVLQTQANIKPIVESFGKQIIHIKNETLQDILKQSGISRDVDFMEQEDNFLYLSESFDPTKIKTDFKFTSLTLDYRADNWNELRIVLDALSNHMPEDSGGKNVKIEYLLSKKNEQGETVKVWSETIGSYTYPEAVRISDDGKGYSLENLLVLHSHKSQNAVGQFGEGLKMLSAACLRKKIPVKFKSRNWVAMPISYQTNIDGKEVQIMGYKTVENIDNVEGSSTTFYKPSEELLKIFRSIEDYVLHFNSSLKVLHEESNGRIISLGYNKKATFVKGFYVADNNSEQFKTLFSYDLITRNIVPDRNFVNHDTLKESIRNLLETNTNPSVVDTILEAAKESTVEYAEFQELNLDKRVKEIWKQSFDRVFGNGTVLDSEDPSFNYEAEHLGYNIVYLNKKLASTLKKAGVKTAKEIAFQSYKTKKIEKPLTEEENKNLALLSEIDSILGLNSPVEIEIYESLEDSTGRDPGQNGFWCGENKKIYLRRSILLNNYELVKTYCHERGHNETEAPDPSDKFRNFFESYLTAFIVRELSERKEELQINKSAFDYSLALKETMATITRYNAETKNLQKEREALETERKNIEKKLEEKYKNQINSLQYEINKLKDELDKEKNMPWYKKIFR